MSYLNQAKWEPDERRILCNSATTFARLQNLVGRPLKASGVSTAFQGCEPRRLVA